jgi:CubicO group peptidase (beta-lactamase class C family)
MSTLQPWRFLCGFLLFLPCLPAAAEDASLASKLAKIEEFLHKKIPADGPGAAVLVVQDGKIIHQKGYGLADLEKKLPITSHTQFDLASVSKQFTAMAILILHDRGQLNIDDDIRKYLPELPEYDPKRPIRIRDLLCHTSGIKDYLFVWRGTDEEFSHLTNEDMLRLLTGQKLVFPTGTKWAYSNSNYLLLPIIVQRVTAKPFRQVLQEEIFRQLGMNHTVVFDSMYATVPERAKGYRKLKEGWKHVAKDAPICGDGNVFTCTEDMAKWDAALREGKLLKPDTLRLAWTPQKLDDGKETQYGFGWGIRCLNGKLIVGHGGGWTGTRTDITRWVDDKLTIVVLCNNEGASPNALAKEIADILLSQPVAPARAG